VIKKQAIECFLDDWLPDPLMSATYDVERQSHFVTIEHTDDCKNCSSETCKYIYIGRADYGRARCPQLCLTTVELMKAAPRLLLEAAQLNPVIKLKDLARWFDDADLDVAGYVEVGKFKLAVTDPELLGIHPIWTRSGGRTENLLVFNVAGVVIVED
jgi:hypothetical protein